MALSKVKTERLMLSVQWNWRCPIVCWSLSAGPIGLDSQKTQDKIREEPKMMSRNLSVGGACVALLLAVGCGGNGNGAVDQPTTVLEPAGTASPADVAADEGLATTPGSDFSATDLRIADAVRAESDLCGIRVNETKLTATPLEIHDGEAVVISGWVANKETMAWPMRPMLLIERGGSHARIWRLDLQSEPTSRGDVEKNFQMSSMRMTGFSVPVDFSGIPSGNYRLHIAHGEDDSLVICRRGGALGIRHEAAQE